MVLSEIPVVVIIWWAIKKMKRQDSSSWLNAIHPVVGTVQSLVSDWSGFKLFFFTAPWHGADCHPCFRTASKTT
jgi:hypothetical protein